MRFRAPLKVGRPLKGDQKRIRVSFTLQPARAMWLERASKNRGLSRSEMLETILSANEKNSSLEELPFQRNLLFSENALRDLCRKYGVRKLAFFGSVLRDDFRPESDIDALVEFQIGKEPGMFGMVTLANELSDLLGGRKVDLKTPAELSKYFRDQVIREAQEVYAA